MGLFDDVASGAVAGETSKNKGGGKAGAKGKPGTFHGIPIWALALGGAALAYLLYKHFQSSSSTSSTTPTSTSQGSTPGQQGYGGGYGGGGYGSGAGGHSFGSGTPSTGNATPASTFTSVPPGGEVLTPTSVTTTTPASLGGTTTPANAASRAGSTTSVAPASIYPASFSTAPTGSAAQILASPTSNPAATVSYINAQQQMPQTSSGGTPSYTGTPLGAGTPVIDTQPAINSQPGYIAPSAGSVAATNVTAPPAFTNPSPKNTTGAAANAAGTAKGTTQPASSQNKAGANPSGKGVVY